VLGLPVQTASGQTYASYVEDHVLRPIGMTHSYTSKDAARADRLASGHRYWFGVPVAADLPYPDGVLPAGYIISTAEDLAHYLAMVQNGGRAGDKTIVSPASMAELLRPGAEAGGPDVFYAMGWTVAQDGDVRVVGHAGGTFDFRAAMSVMPERDLGYVLLMNADTAPPGPSSVNRCTSGADQLLTDQSQLFVASEQRCWLGRKRRGYFRGAVRRMDSIRHLRSTRYRGGKLGSLLFVESESGGQCADGIRVRSAPLTALERADRHRSQPCPFCQFFLSQRCTFRDNGAAARQTPSPNPIPQRRPSCRRHSSGQIWAMHPSVQRS
jgi:CubicO group peptidase (beta-lactamase class C family)